VNNLYTSEFRVESGVKQGDPLSPMLFSLVIDTILKKLDIRGNISVQLRQLMAYADCILITALTKHSLMDTFQQLKNNSLEVGLTINEKKTKYLQCAKKDIKIENLNIRSSYIEQVKQYNYLGSIINYTNSIKEEVKERIALGIKAYYANLKFFKIRLVTKSSKLKLYRTVIRPIVTRASETWVLKENIIQKLLVFERKILGGIFGPTKENQTWRIKNNEELGILDFKLSLCSICNMFSFG